MTFSGGGGPTRVAHISGLNLTADLGLSEALVTRGESGETRKHLLGARLLADQIGAVRQRRRIASIGLAA
jgi:hypothetical protein